MEQQAELGMILGVISVMPKHIQEEDFPFQQEEMLYSSSASLQTGGFSFPTHMPISAEGTAKRYGP